MLSWGTLLDEPFRHGVFCAFRVAERGLRAPRIARNIGLACGGMRCQLFSLLDAGRLPSPNPNARRGIRHLLYGRDGGASTRFAVSDPLTDRTLTPGVAFGDASGALLGCAKRRRRPYGRSALLRRRWDRRIRGMGSEARALSPSSCILPQTLLRAVSCVHRPGGCIVKRSSSSSS